MMKVWRYVGLFASFSPHLLGSRSPPVPLRRQFSPVQDGIYALGKVHIRSTPSLGGFPNVAFETVGMNSEHCMNNMNSAGLTVHV